MRRLIFLLLGIVSFNVASVALAREREGVLVDLPELVVVKQGQSETIALPATAYRDLVVTAEQATFVIEGYSLPEGHERISSGEVTQVTWTPQRDGSTAVVIDFGAPPLSSLINAVDGTQDRLTTPQVIAGFTFPQDEAADSERRFPVLGSYGKDDSSDAGDEHGNYVLPDMPPVKYSDALVTLQVNGVDFRDVLWFLSEVGNISIMLDPYWDDEPTGNPRPVGAGADGGTGGGGEGDPGFRGAGGFVPGMMREGTGNLSLNFQEVPFDRALELVVMAAGLVMVEIEPQS